MALSFMKKGYNVVERSQLKAIIDENSIMAAGKVLQKLIEKIEVQMP